MKSIKHFSRRLWETSKIFDDIYSSPDSTGRSRDEPPVEVQKKIIQSLNCAPDSEISLIPLLIRSQPSRTQYAKSGYGNAI